MTKPSMDAWLAQAKQDPRAGECGMYLFHNGVVRQSPKVRVREGSEAVGDVRGMIFSFDREKVASAEAAARALPGIFYVRAWLNEGELAVGDDIMQVLIGGDIRPRVVEALQFLVSELKNNCVTEQELF